MTLWYQEYHPSRYSVWIFWASSSFLHVLVPAAGVYSLLYLSYYRCDRWLLFCRACCQVDVLVPIYWRDFELEPNSIYLLLGLVYDVLWLFCRFETVSCSAKVPFHKIGSPKSPSVLWEICNQEESCLVAVHECCHTGVLTADCRGESWQANLLTTILETLLS